MVSIDSFTSFATEGLILPAFMIAGGLTMALAAPFFPEQSQKNVAQQHPAIRYLATRRWDRKGGLFVMAIGILITVLRLSP